MRSPLRLSSLLAVLAVLTLAGCDDVNVIGPANQLEVTNAADQFQFQVSDLVNVDDSRSYSWQNSGQQATIDVTQAMTGGSASLTIRDAEGTVLYQELIADAVDTTTPAGSPGTWTIDVQLDGATGTFNFRVQKTT